MAEGGSGITVGSSLASGRPTILDPMPDSALIIDYLDSLVLGSCEEFRVALALPRSGALGLARPAALAAAVMAAEEINERGGVAGRQMTVTLVDAGQSPAASAHELGGLVEAGCVAAVVGFHTSDVHRALEPVASGRVPYVFAAPHEGGSRLDGVGLIGPDPHAQLDTPVRTLVSRGLRRWALLGNDYIWPRAVHRTAARLVHDSGGVVRESRLVPLGQVDGELLVHWVRETRADVVLLSLVGRDLAYFNRAFAASGLMGRVVRVSGSLDEVGLLEAGGDTSGDLFAAMDWYVGDAADGFAARYVDRWGAAAPQLGVYARGTYDALHAVSRAAGAGRLSATRPNAGLMPAPARPSRLACADGLRLVPLAAG